ncbi:MAG: site-specific integrase, partial [Gallionella sp.]
MPGTESDTTSATVLNERYLQGYLAWLRFEKRYSELTAENYARDLRHLFELSSETPLSTLKVHQIRRYVAQLHGQGLSGRSLARMLSAWRGFFTYLMRDHGHSDNPCTGLRAPKSPKTLPQALSPDEAGRLMAIPGDDAEALRDKAIVELLYSSGLRLAELVSMELADMQAFLGSGEVRVTGKGNKTRIVPLGSFATTA